MMPDGLSTIRRTYIFFNLMSGSAACSLCGSASKGHERSILSSEFKEGTILMNHLYLAVCL